MTAPWPPTGPQPQQPYPQQPYPPQGFPPQGFPPQQQYPPQQGFPPQQYPQQPPQPQVQAPPPGAEWAVNAERKTPFIKLVLAEFMKLTGTLSDRITLAVGPIFLFALLFVYSALAKSGMIISAYDQVVPLILVTQFGSLFLLVSVIKLVAGEWQYKSVQPTLLVQPARLRYLAAQATVIMIVWFVTALSTFGLFLLFRGIGADASNVGYLLPMRLGWVLLIAVLSTFMVLAASLIIAMLLPNSTGALVVYFLTVPLLLFVREMAPQVFGPLYPLEMAYYVAGEPNSGAIQAWISLVVWLALLVFGAFLVRRRDAG
ncbi:hypothetical protein [Allokutzneria sp. NRRL B-24872]|uniref:hypothetical protein n=1 Tax=Allokutzneria sp. NRRL B-24872 TaxID=1137961 RepID=UPI000A3D5216|nr:hypothetical protein [Allokutzneria sp. NRRL B-24872]